MCVYYIYILSMHCVHICAHFGRKYFILIAEQKNLILAMNALCPACILQFASAKAQNSHGSFFMKWSKLVLPLKS